MELKIRVPRYRFIALVAAASKVGCICADPAERTHDGMCIGCWALARRVEHLRTFAPGSPTLTRRLEECEEEQRFRQREIPKAELRLAEARRADEIDRQVERAERAAESDSEGK